MLPWRQNLRRANQRYTGREDDGSGLYYYRARYYDPALGRFISEDPLGFDAGDINLYQYAAANPINHNDPSGKILPAIAAGCAAAPVLCAGAVSAVSSAVFGSGVRYFSGDSVTAGTVATDAAIGAVGGAAFQGAYRAYQGAQAGVGITRSAYIGALGEQAAGVTGAKTAIQSATGTAARRFPDKIDDVARTLTEVKNKAALSAKDARQIADDVAFASNNPGYTVNLQARYSTNLGSRVQSFVDNGQVSLSYLPGIANDGFGYLSPYLAGGLGAGLGSLSGTFGGSAGGGFLLYPNKSNNNMMQSVYSK